MKVPTRATRMKAEKEIEFFSECFNKIFNFLKMMKREQKDIEGGRCTPDTDERLRVNDINRKRIWKQYMEGL